MEGWARIVFPIVMSGIMISIVSGFVTFLNLGWRSDFPVKWLHAFAVAWPLGAVAAFVAIPIARRVTMWIVTRIEGTP